MKREISIRVLACALISPPVFADFGVGSTFYWGPTGDEFANVLTAAAKVSLTHDDDASEGGAFWVNLFEGSLGPVYDDVDATLPRYGVFSTFCIESTISFGENVGYWASIDQAAYSGGVPGSAGNPITDVSEWIYEQWLAGNEEGWTQKDISEAIWMAEGQTKGKNNNVYESALQELYGASDYAGPIGLASHNIAALNLWTIEWDEDEQKFVATDVQSQLIWVPVPGAALLGFLGLGVAGLKLRKRV